LALDQGKLSSFDDGDEEHFESLRLKSKQFSCFYCYVSFVFHIAETYIAPYCLSSHIITKKTTNATRPDGTKRCPRRVHLFGGSGYSSAIIDS
jgi:hypothetical protein